MQPITRRMLRVLHSDTFDPFNLVSILLPAMTSGSAIRITDAGQAISFGGATYDPCPLSVSDSRNVLDTESGEQPSITIAVQNVDRQFASLLNRYEFDGAKVSVWKWDRRLYAMSGSPNERDAIMAYRGELRNAVLADRTLQFEAMNVVSLIEQQVVPRRVFQSGCNVTYGSLACGANAKEAPNRIASTVQAGSDRKRLLIAPAVFTAAGNPDDPTEYWKNGYILIASGSTSIAQSRSIQEFRDYGGDTYAYLKDPYLIDPTVGDAIVVQRGCPKTKEACFDRQGHVLNFQGYSELPAEMRPVTLKAHDQD